MLFSTLILLGLLSLLLWSSRQRNFGRVLQQPTFGAPSATRFSTQTAEAELDLSCSCFPAGLTPDQELVELICHGPDSYHTHLDEENPIEARRV